MLGEVNALERAIDRKIAKAAGKRTRAAGTVSRIDVDGTVYVLLDGADGDTIVSASTASVKPGDAVSVRIENGRAVIEGNTSDPSASSAQLVQTARKADSALVEAERAHQAADEAEQDAARAATAADNAETEASRAATAAVNAEASAGHAATSASNAEASASQASASAGQAATSASQAATSAGQAATSASNAATSASEAADAAHDARERADDALSAANAARDSAGDATLYATSALGQLGVVQDVVGVLDWVMEHGRFVPTTDTSVDAAKVYYIYSVSDGYVPVVDPRASDIGSYFELEVNEAIQGFIMAHLAVTDRGLWVLPSGIDAQVKRYIVDSSGNYVVDADGNSLYAMVDEVQYSSGYKVLLANDGMYVYDGEGVLVSTFGENIEFSSLRAQYIGNEDAFIAFTPRHVEDGQEVAATITIGGANVIIGSTKKLSELLGDVEQASSDAAAAKDICTIAITSTGGTVFKQDRGVSTTLIVTVFTGDGLRIADITSLRSRFGNGAYLQWRWKDDPEDEFSILLNTDPRIGAGGFTLTVSPSDISTQAIIDCDLIF